MKKTLLSGLILFAVVGTAFAQALPDPVPDPGEPGSDITSPSIFSGEVDAVTGEVDAISGEVDRGRTVLPKITNPLKKEFSDIPSLIKGLVDIILKLATILAVLALVWVGLKFILAQGNPTEIAKARQALWWVIIGIAILFGAQIIVEIIKGTLSDFVDPTKIKFN